MAINEYKLKATDYLTESLKLIVVVVTILMTGLLTFLDKVNTSNKYYFYSAISLWLITLVWSVINLNLLINKMYRGEENAIKQKDTKSTFTFTTITLILGIIAGILFLYSLSNINKKSTNNINHVNQINQISITDNEIIMDSDFTKKIKIIKFKDGKLNEVHIN